MASGGAVILVRPDTSTADVVGFAASEGILTAVGARTAHAALVARQMGKPCVVGCPRPSSAEAHGEVSGLRGKTTLAAEPGLFSASG
jgi:pyruvate, orthophosphate dikinase